MLRSVLRKRSSAVAGVLVACLFIVCSPSLMAQAADAGGSVQTGAAPPASQAPPSLGDLGFTRIRPREARRIRRGSTGARTCSRSINGSV